MAELKRVISSERAAEIEKKATDTLKAHGLFSIPVDPVMLANRLGIKVNNAVFKDDGYAGLIAKRGDAMTLLVNANDTPVRKKFTIAHELGHHFLHLHSSDGEFIDENMDHFRDIEVDIEKPSEERIREVEANYFAAALLMPKELVLQEFKECQDVEKLAKKFNVSVQAMDNRLNRL